MADKQLTVTTDAGAGSRTQTATQSPQTAAGAASNGSVPSGLVQPATASQSLISSTGGDTLLKGQSLIVAGVSSKAIPSTSTVQPPKLAPVANHHINLVLLGGAGLLLILALVTVIIISRSVKSTTDYR